MKEFTLGVSDFAIPVLRKGSINIHSGYGGRQQGAEIHKEIQQQRKKDYPNYQSEIPISYQFIFAKYIFNVIGRMDGIFQGSDVKIEEIKSSFNIQKLAQRLLSEQNEHPYCLQLQTYGYMHWLKAKKIPELSLHLVSTRNGETIQLKLELNICKYEQWLNLRLRELCKEANLANKRLRRRIDIAKQMVFPFAHPRSGQLELMNYLQQGMQEKNPMLIQAPTGLGKTIGVLYPVLKEALLRGQKVIYLTPKNSQHVVAEEAIRYLQGSDLDIKYLTLTAKNKLCFKNETICNPEYCEYAKNYYNKVAKNKLLVKHANEKILNAKLFKDIGKKYEVCPAELQLEFIPQVDAIICDYNYVFSPFSLSERLIKNTIPIKEKPNLIIDEMHNLPNRAMGYYSSFLSVAVLEKLQNQVYLLSPRFQNKFTIMLDECISIIKNAAPKGISTTCVIEPPVQVFIEQHFRIKELLSTYLESDVLINSGDLIINLNHYWSEFMTALTFANRNEGDFFTTFYPQPAMIKITCCNAGSMLKNNYKNYQQIIGFSATLKPFQFYTELTGLSSHRIKTAEFTSSFPPEHRKVLIIPQVSSKYAVREKNYPRIAEAIQKITALKSGNYFVFCPSFDFLNCVLKAFTAPPNFTTLCQERSMKKSAIKNMLQRFKDPTVAHIFFAVQGGVFSEGIDYPGDMAIGAFVVGSALPNFDLEREKMKEYYEKNYGAGFDYAYVYPAMAKAVQAAGRVIRSAQDKGILVLMDHRFIHDNYSKCMPQDWFNRHPNEIVSRTILNDITKFWATSSI